MRILSSLEMNTPEQFALYDWLTCVMNNTCTAVQYVYEYSVRVGTLATLEIGVGRTQASIWVVPHGVEAEWWAAQRSCSGWLGCTVRRA